MMITNRHLTGGAITAMLAGSFLICRVAVASQPEKEPIHIESGSLDHEDILVPVPGPDHGLAVLSLAKSDDESAEGSKELFDKRVVIKSVEPDWAGEWPGRSDGPWLGLATDEAAESLSSQLGLDPGVGLIVTYVNNDSPAAKAGLKKNDLLLEFEGQKLVHPAQFRKLVRSRKIGDEVKLAYLRGGRREEVEMKLAKAPADRLFFGSDSAKAQEALKDLQIQLKDMPFKDAFHESMKSFHDSMGNLKIDQKKVQDEVRRSMEEAKRALEHALHQIGESAKGVQHQLKQIEKSDVVMDDDAKVTVRSTGKKVRSTVVSDDSGTIIIVCNPKPHLTAHDKDGKLVFDGEISTDGQRKEVPPDLLKKVEPLLDKMKASDKDEE